MSNPEVVSNRQPNKLAIIDLVLDREPGDLILDKEITEATKSQMIHWMSAMQAARSVLSKEHSIELMREKKVGYRVLMGAEKSGAADRRMKRARNQVKTAHRIVSSVTSEEFDAMGKVDQVTLLQTRAHVSMAFDLLSMKKKEIPTKSNNGNQPTVNLLDFAKKEKR